MMDGEELLRFVWGQEFVEDSLVDVRRWFVTCYTHTERRTHRHTDTQHRQTDRQTDTPTPTHKHTHARTQTHSS
jgi:hypothetical protein